MRERFGRELTLPGARGRYARVGPPDRGAERRLRPANRDATKGDGVLMAAAARRHSLGHHIGIWCAVAGEPYVLHCLKGVGSILHPIRDLDRRAFVLEGVYRDNRPVARRLRAR